MEKERSRRPNRPPEEYPQFGRELGARLRQIRELHQLSIDDAVDLIKPYLEKYGQTVLTPKKLIGWETGNRPVNRITDLVAIADAYEVSVDEITGRDVNSIIADYTGIQPEIIGQLKIDTLNPEKVERISIINHLITAVLETPGTDQK